jgi:hypothetical protein
MVQADLDTATPAAGAQRLHQLLSNSRLVTLRNAQKHLVYLTYGNACVDTTVTSYLATGQLPAADVTCTNAIATEPSSASPTRGSR